MVAHVNASVKMGTKEATLVTGSARSTSMLGKMEGLDFMVGYKERINVFPVVLCFE